MRVLLLTNALAAGGAEIFVVELARALVSLGHDAAVCVYAGVLDKKGKELVSRLADGDIPFFNLDAQSIVKKVLCPILVSRVIKQFRPDVVHTHLVQSDLLGLLANLMSPYRGRPRFVRTIHSIKENKKFHPFVQKTVARFFDAQVNCSDHVRSGFPYRAAKDNIVIENGIEIREKEGVEVNGGSLNDSQFKRLRRDFKYIIVSIGSFLPRNGVLPKGQDVIISSIKKLSRDDVALCFLGNGGGEFSRIKDLVLAQGLDSQVYFAGIVEEVTPYLRAADLFLMPSRFEGFPISAIEAACAGMPMILSTISAFDRFDYSGTLRVDSDDVESLTAAIDKMLTHLPQFRRDAQAMRERYIEQFDITNVARQYIELFARL